MKKIYVLKVGTTFPAVEAQFGDFDDWTAAALGVGADAGAGAAIGVVDVEGGDDFPPIESCAAVVITGSHSMVTDNLPWSVALEAWLRSALETDLPILGVCYGHQLLGRAAGGEVGNHPKGKEIGTVDVTLLPEVESDPLFQSLPKTFAVHTTHRQSVLRLPPGATRLAGNDYEPNHAYRLRDMAYGVQFHPEYSADIMRAYIEGQREELEKAGKDVAALLAEVRDTPFAAKLIRDFSALVSQREGLG